LDTLNARLRAAEAVLDASAKDVREELVRKALATTTDALRTSIERLEVGTRELAHVRDLLAAAHEEHRLLSQSMPVAYVTTARSGEIVEANPHAGMLLNTSVRHLIGKSLLLFFEDRKSWEATLRTLRKFDDSIRRPIIVRPRERASKPILACVSCIEEDTLWWFLLPGRPHEDG
jgi:PAS domain-containing protein